MLLVGLSALFIASSNRSYARAIREFESWVGPADLARYVGEPIPAEQNTAIAVPLAAKDVVLDAGWALAPEPAAWSAAEAEEARNALAREQPTIEAVERALALSGCRWPAVQAEVTAWSIPMLASSRLLRLMGFVGVLDGDRSQIQRSFRDLGELADCVYTQPGLAGSLVASAVSRARLEVARAALASPSTGPELLDWLATELESSFEVDRIAWALGSEGAFALHFVQNPQLAGADPQSGGFYSIFSRRVATDLADRWVELSAWSEEPLETLLSKPRREAQSGVAVTGVIADIMLPNLRDAVVKLRTLRELTGIALTAIEVRGRGLEHGNYDGPLTARHDLETIREADGSVMILDPKLERLLRQHYAPAGPEPYRGIEATLQLTVWRLPAAGGR